MCPGVVLVCKSNTGVLHIFPQICESSGYTCYWPHVSGNCGVFVDFEDTLCNAASDTFPGTKVFGKSFHFMQANLCWMAKNCGEERGVCAMVKINEWDEFKV